MLVATVLLYVSLHAQPVGNDHATLGAVVVMDARHSGTAALQQQELCAQHRTKLIYYESDTDLNGK